MNQPSFFSEPRRNTGLFSQYYLDEVLLPSFGEATNVSRAADLGLNYFENKFDALEPIILKNEEIAARRNERQLEEDVIKPILDLLGHYYDVAPHAKGDVPDYILFPTEENKNEAKTLKPTSDEYQKLNVGILDAKAWKESRRAGVMDEANISQIFRYLINFRRRWGVLTDGFRWILFANKQGIRQDQYIEFNLRDIIRSKDRGQNPNFRLFVFLFRREAFSRVPGSDALLDKILDESAHNAEKLQSDLKKKVYDAFGIVAEDFRSQKRLQLATPEEMADLKEYSLIVLYRILFLLFGESRLILPVRPETNPYYNHSLERIIEMMEDETKPQAHGSKYWAFLSELFGIIHGLEDDGSPSRLGEDIGLPAYNGGLFDPNNYKKFASWRLGDKALKQVIDLLAYTGDKQKSNSAKRVRVSYRDLGVQHLGNIYEGILENHLQLATDGTIEVVTDKKERKATGSYYTPDYIVDYIVKETLGPLVTEAKNREELLRINVLDPAMGSGHFLIGAIDYLAEELAQKDLAEAKYTESDLQEARRTVAERCIYGVDLNPMAVELAKLSIWLHTISSQKPLTFLDNHIKCGNSLIGAWISDLKSLPDKKKKQSDSPVSDEESLFPTNFLEQDTKVWLKSGEIFAVPSDDITGVKEKELVERDLDENRKPYRTIANFWTSLYFMGLPLDDASLIMRELREVRDFSHPNLAKYADVTAESEKIAKEKRFFHWELEFPEIFFDKHGRRKDDEAGFDAVIGNPPYGAEIKGIDRRVLPIFFPETSVGQLDSYKLFMQRASGLGKLGCFAGFILSDSFLEKEYFSDLRTFIAARSRRIRTIRLGEYVFNEVQLPTALLFFNKGNKSLTFEFFDISFPPNNSDRAIKLASSFNFITITPDFEKTLVPQLPDNFQHRVVSLIDVYDEVMGVKVYQRGKGKPSQSDDHRLQDIFVSKEVKKNWLPFYSEGIYRYTDVWNGEFISYGEWLAEARELRYFDQPKVVLREIVNPRPFATFLDRTAVIKNTAAVFIPKDPRYSLFYLLALLNSAFFKFKIFQLSPKRENKLYPSFTSKLLKGLPVVEISFLSQKKDRERLSNSLIKQLSNVLVSINDEKASYEIEEQFKPVVALAKEYSESKNDVLHDFLSHLAEQMLAMNKEKQSVAQKFFEWMEHYGIPPLENMKPKTALDEFWKLEFKDLLAHLKKNKVSIPTSTQNDLLERFTEASETLKSLDAKIAHTDWLIDQVVYALYGLTEEEIAIVERS